MQAARLSPTASRWISIPAHCSPENKKKIKTKFKNKIKMTLEMSVTQLVHDVSSVNTSFVAQLLGDDLQLIVLAIDFWYIGKSIYNARKNI